MPSRHRSRESALQVLFLADIRQQPPDAAIRAFYESLHSAEEDDPPPVPDPFMEQLVRGTMEAMGTIDKRIAGHSEHWRLERMPIVDRNVLRLAVHEMTSLGTPAPVVIDEALELARRFSSEESVAFINGVLDAVRKDVPAADQFLWGERPAALHILLALPVEDLPRSPIMQEVARQIEGRYTGPTRE